MKKVGSEGGRKGERPGGRERFSRLGREVRVGCGVNARWGGGRWAARSGPAGDTRDGGGLSKRNAKPEEKKESVGGEF